MPGTAFPTLTVTATLPVPRKPRSNTISSEAEAGYKQTRPRHTRKVYDFGPVKYPVLNETEKDAIQAHFDEVGCTVVFPWEMPVECITHNVRYKDPGPQFEPIAYGIWSVTFELEGA